MEGAFFVEMTWQQRLARFHRYVQRAAPRRGLEQWRQRPKPFVPRKSERQPASRPK